MLNHLSIMGRLTRAPELRRTQAGTAVTSFTIACERDYEQNGERQTDFFDCVAWSGTGEFIERNFNKGQMIALTGRLQLTSWTNDNGDRHHKTEILVSGAYFAGNKKSATDDSAYKDVTYKNPFKELTDYDGDLPF